MNSLYMNTQMKLLESEYGVKLNYYKGTQDENPNIVDDEEVPIIKVKKKSNKSNNNIDDNNNINNNNKEDNEKDINEDLCVLKVKDSSQRNINDDIKNNE